MTKSIILGPGLKLPTEDFIERATALLAKRGKGKSGGVKVIEEALLEAGMPFVVFDPVGIHWGLKSTFDGKKASGYEVLVFGGEHGDLPFDRKAGRNVARNIATSGASLVIDFKSVPHAAYREFVADFADELANVNQHPRLLIFEEASRLIPQRVRPDQTACLDAVQRLVLEGRNAALGCIVVSQRAATLNKDVLTQMDNLIILGITGPQDRKAIKEWVEQNADEADLDQFFKELAGLQPREAWFWSPDMGIFQKFRFKDFTTFHPDRTHLRRLGLLSVKPVQTDVSKLVEQLGAEMKALADKAKADDPKELRLRIKQLEKELAAKEPEVRVEEREVEKPVPYIPQSLRDAIEKVSMDLQGAMEAAEEDIENTTVSITVPKLSQISPKDRRTRTIPGVSVTVQRPKPVPTKPVFLGGNSVDRDGNLTQSDRRILTVLAQRPEGVAIDRLAILSGYSVNGRFTNLLGQLRSRDLISPARVSPITITAKGFDMLGPFEDLPTGKELQTWWLQRLSPSEQRIMQVLFNLGADNFIDITSLAEASGYSVNGRFTNLLGKLRTRGLVSPARQPIKAAPEFFEE